MDGAIEQRRKNAGAKLSSDTQARLGKELRAMYAELVRQQLPDRITKLMFEAIEDGEGEVEKK
jgi:hypothetical protein